MDVLGEGRTYDLSSIRIGGTKLTDCLGVMAKSVDLIS